MLITDPLALRLAVTRLNCSECQSLRAQAFPSITVKLSDIRPHKTHQTPGALPQSHLLKKKSHLRNERGANISPNLVNAAIVKGTQAR